MNLIQYPLFPTLILRFLKFVDSKECKKIFKLLKTKKCSDHLSLIKGKSSHKENYDVLSFTSLDLTNALKEYSRQSHFELENKSLHNDLWKVVKRMDSDFEPFDLNWNGVKWGEIHFSDPKLIAQLKWMPYIEILCGILFLVVFFWAFKIIMQSERNLIYVVLLLTDRD